MDFKRCDLGLQVQPTRGTVILWYNKHPDGKGDRASLHGGCPPGPGETKWSGNKWIYVKPQGSRLPEWLPDHPALQRLGWQGPQEPKAPPAEKGSCALRVVSELQAPAALAWVDRAKGERKKVGDLAPGQQQKLNSWQGHAFVVQAGGLSSEEFVCQAPGSTFAVLEGLRVQLRPHQAEL